MTHTTVPSDLPVPKDDGACNHLTGTTFPSIQLPSTAGNNVNLSTLSGLTVLFCYPRTGAPDETIPDPWNEIPGARGCTPQACSFRDAAQEFLQLGVSHIFGASTQDTPYQREVKERVHLPYQLLSDEKLELQKALDLPTFEWQDKKLIKRMSMVVEDGKIIKVFYPVFPPSESANEVMKWLRTYAGRQNLSTVQENETMRNLQHR
ncbi:redoxin family [Lecanosticta acicola]|uniref:Redoxin family n=1 Tax=Lecanosticta acicola TaxID=111012 RepID=A0AAI8YVX3_9PEZI|nr:redoxin family [Lecanosticta acicola]